MCPKTSFFSLFQPNIVVNCPKSLKCLITYYRCLGFTFTGVVFSDCHQSSLSKSGENRLKLINRLFLLWHLFFLFNTALFATSSLVNIWPSSKPDNLINKMHRSPFNQYGRLMKFSVDQYNFEYAHFKVILRGSLALIGHLFVGDNLLNYVLNLLYGQKLLEMMLALPNIRKLDDNSYLGFKLILLPMLFHFAGILFALVTFARPYLFLLINWTFGTNDSTKFSDKQLEDVGQLLVIIFIWPQYFLLQLKSTVIYFYLMAVFQQNLLLLSKNIQESSSSSLLDDQKLVRLRGQLRSLAGHLRKINGLLSAPLAWALISSVHLIVATVCYFVVLNRRNSYHYYSVVLFAHLLFALLRLVMLSVAGSWPPAAYEQLLLVLYENIAKRSSGDRRLVDKENNNNNNNNNNSCSLQTWIVYQQLRGMEGRFRSRLCWDAGELSQGSLLAVLGFALSYIIILLQTEDSW